MPPFSIVDVETTGCRADAHRVIEVAVVRVERRRVVDRWSSLLRPDHPVPAWITRLTGIRDEDLRTAPAFAEIARDLLRRLSGTVFVAHNAAFDAGFLRAEFARTGRRWRPDSICTVRLARALLPDLAGHSLDHLADFYGLAIERRHRALGDAEATAHILCDLLARPRARAEIARQLKTQVARRALPLPPGADDLPHGRGVWILRDRDDRVLRTGRSISLFDAFCEEFSRLPRRVTSAAARVDFVACSSDVEAQDTEARLAPAPPPDAPAFLVVRPDGTLAAGGPQPGRLFGAFPSLKRLNARIARARRLPLDQAIAEITRDLSPLGLFRRPAPSAGPGMLVRDQDRLLWIQQGRLRKAWTLGPDCDESAIREEIRSLLPLPFDPDRSPAVSAGRGIPVEAWLR